MYRLFHPGFDLDIESEDPKISHPAFPLICNEECSALLTQCFSRAAFFSLTRAPWDMSADMGMEDSLAPYIQRRFHSQNWFCYEVRPDQPLEITVYRAEDGARDVLSHYVQELFLQRRVNGKWEDSDKTLEDLCFFDRESRLFFGTVTHETLCYIYPPDRAFEEMLSQNQYWIAEPDIGQQQIDLRNFVSG